MSKSCGIARYPSPRPCKIRAETKNRNGTARWWCLEHGCPAWGPSGVRLERCAGATSVLPPPGEVLRLDPGEFPGGVGVWGAIDPVYAWGLPDHDEGVHVHARLVAGGPKVIDATYAAVVVAVGDIDITIDATAARNYSLSAIAGVKLVALECPRCQERHVDMAQFAVIAHRRHQCNRCGGYFWAKTESVGNPCAALQEALGLRRHDGTVSERRLVLEQQMLKGLALWGTNPAIIWTGGTPEEIGIHVHAMDSAGRLLDETYGAVTVDGIELDPLQVRVLMAQRAIPDFTGRVVVMSCTQCGTAHFDVGSSAWIPGEKHSCKICGMPLTHAGRFKRVISNPLVASLPLLIAGRSPLESRGIA